MNATATARTATARTATQPTRSQLETTARLNSRIAAGDFANAARVELKARAQAEQDRRASEPTVRTYLATQPSGVLADIEQFNRFLAADRDEPMITRTYAHWTHRLVLAEIGRRG